LYVISITRREPTPRDLRSEPGVTVAGSTPQAEAMILITSEEGDPTQKNWPLWLVGSVAVEREM